MTSRSEEIPASDVPVVPAQSPRQAAPGASREYAETRFRVGPADYGTVTTVVMRTGPWMNGPDGVPALGSLGVLVDDALGSAIYSVRPPGTHSVTAELSLDVLVPPPWTGPELVARASLLGQDSGGGVASCEVLDGDGRVVLIATGRCRFIPMAGLPPETGKYPVHAVSPPHHSILEALGLASRDGNGLADVIERTETGGTLVTPVNPPLTNPHGTVHGGILLCFSDLLAAALSDDPSAPRPERTLSLRINFLRPGDPAQPVTYTAETVHRGRSLSLYRVTAAGPAGKPYTVATVSRGR